MDDISPAKIREFRAKKKPFSRTIGLNARSERFDDYPLGTGSSSPTGTASAVLAAITSGTVGHSILGLGPLGVSALGFMGGSEAFEDGEKKEVVVGNRFFHRMATFVEQAKLSCHRGTIRTGWRWVMSRT